MAECISCGTHLSYFQGDEHRRCSTCSKANKWPIGHRNHSVSAEIKAEKQDAKSNKQSHPTASEGSTPVTTAFTSLAWVIVALTFICTLIATFATAVGGDAFLAMIIFISGCFSAVLLGLLTEISANIAKLVNNSR